MKLNKIAAIAIAALAMTACSDDNDSLNSAADVAVNMENATFSTRENAKIFNVPIAVTGKTNGDVIVYVETSENTTEGETAVENVNYIVTSDRIIIPAGETKGVVEICAVDNKEENDSRYFNLTITKVEGAQLGDLKTTVVELRDNDQDPYDKLCGDGWHITAYSVFDGGDNLIDIAAEMVAPDTNDPDEAAYYGHELYLHFPYGGLDCFMTLSYSYDEINDEMSLAVVPGTSACWSVLNFGSFKGVFIAATTYDRNGATLGDDEPLIPTMEGNKVVALDFENPGAMFFLSVFEYPGLSSFKGYYEGWADFTITRD
ncbi:MAG: hypothetical protein K2J06_09405 [Muribaculaceae bacterium]|nr:hypothetical protein [Muribaculaceae bacterium]